MVATFVEVFNNYIRRIPLNLAELNCMINVTVFCKKHQRDLIIDS